MKNLWRRSNWSWNERQYFKKGAENQEPEVVNISKEQEQFILDNAHLNVPPEYKNKYLNLLLWNHDVISANKYDLGKCSTAIHDIELKSKETIYIKHFRIPEAQRHAVEAHVKELLKLGVIRPSRYNSPIFFVHKKKGGIRIVHDFRADNNETLVDKYSMRDVLYKSVLTKLEEKPSWHLQI